MTRNLLLFLILAMSVVSCSKEIANYVRGDRDTANSGPSTSTSNSLSLKLSPGASYSAGSTVKGRMVISPTSQTIEGSQIKAVISFQQNRPN